MKVDFHISSRQTGKTTKCVKGVYSFNKNNYYNPNQIALMLVNDTPTISQIKGMFPGYHDLNRFLVDSFTLKNFTFSKHINYLFIDDYSKISVNTRKFLHTSFMDIDNIEVWTDISPYWNRLFLSVIYNLKRNSYFIDDNGDNKELFKIIKNVFKTDQKQSKDILISKFEESYYNFLTDPFTTIYIHKNNLNEPEIFQYPYLNLIDFFSEKFSKTFKFV